MKTLLVYLKLLFLLIVGPGSAYSQITANMCNNPTNIIYGLSQAGTIYPIDVNNGNTGAVIKNSTYAGNAPSASNAMGYNVTNGRFYYFKRNVTTGAPQEFVSFQPTTGTVTLLANNSFFIEAHTGCVNLTGTGYYSIDVDGQLGFYNIAANTWTRITGNFVDNYGANVTAVIQSQIAGDLAFDGHGNLWIVTSSATNYAVYRLAAPVPTTPVASLTVTRRVAPTTATPSGNMIAGIAFNPTGQIMISTKYDDRLYVLENNLTTTFKGNLGVADIGNDLTSCSFPLAVLPVIWKNFNAVARRENEVVLTWTVSEDNNRGFYVEYSADGSNWTELSYIPSKNIPNTEVSYSFIHINNNEGKHYYRVREVCDNEERSYSQVRVVTLKNNSNGISIWPNPVTDNFSINNTARNEQFYTKARLFDMSGKLIQSTNLIEGINTINTDALPKGIYMLKISGDNITDYTQKIVKQ